MQLPFDEINALNAKSGIYRLYSELLVDIRKAYRTIAYQAYTSALVKNEDDTGKSDEIVENTLNEFCQLTGYIFLNEFNRKRDRLFEGVVCAPDRTKLRDKFAKSARSLYRQLVQYGDIVVDNSRKKAFEDSGVKRVKWVTQCDDKVCEDCKPLNGKIFYVNKIPAKPHYGCRCYLVPVVK